MWTLSLPLFQRYAIDNFIEQGTTEGIWLFAAVYFVVITLQCLGVVVFTRRAMFIEMSVGRDLKRACFVHLQELSFTYYNATPVGYMHGARHERYRPHFGHARLGADRT